MNTLKDIDSVKELAHDSQLAFLYVSSPDCNVCKQLLPKVEEMLDDFPEIQRGYVDVGDVPTVAGEFSVFSVPVLLLFIEGREAIRESRYVNMQELRGKIERYCSMLKD